MQRLLLIEMTPSKLKYLNEILTDSSIIGKANSIVICGEVLTGEVITRWKKLDQNTRLNNLYGPTETTVGCCIYEHNNKLPLRKGPLPIGKPIFNTQLYILNTHYQPVPVGVIGELYIGGAGVARGYLNRLDLTQERFIQNPFATVETEAQGWRRLYKTGDLARYLPDGTIEYLCRTDYQVKLRGFRIELGEIESSLYKCPEIKESVVVVKEDLSGEKRLVAYLVHRQGMPTNELAATLIKQLHDVLNQQIPHYMVPSAFVFLAEMPLTPNGKLNRQALPVPEGDQYVHSESYIAPRTCSERAVAELWQELLHIPQVGMKDNFFHLGGHSLLATRLMSRLRQLFKIELPLKVLFDKPTLAELVDAIVEAQQAAERMSAPPLVPQARPQQLPLSYAQQRLWFIDQLQPNSALYNIPAAIRLHGYLNIVALQQALDMLVARHEVLRTHFEVTPEGFGHQVIVPNTRFTLKMVDLCSLERVDRETALQHVMVQEAGSAFELDKGPLVRGQLVRLDDAEYALLLTMHHSVFDGWSWRVLREELNALYAAYDAGQTNPLAALPIQYADFTLWQRDWLQGEVLDRQLAYWQAKLANLPDLLALPTDHLRPKEQSYRGGFYTFQVPLESLHALKALGESQQASLYMVLLACFDVFLYRYTNHDDIVVGTPIANRHYQELEGLIGFFVNTLVLRTSCQGDKDFIHLLKEVRQCALEAYSHQDIPFEQLVDHLKITRDLTSSSYFPSAI